MARKTRNPRRTKSVHREDVPDTGRIRRWLDRHGLGMDTVDGRRTLVRLDRDGQWCPVSTPKPVRTWAQALEAAVASQLCPALPPFPPAVTERNFSDATYEVGCADGEAPIRLTEYQHDAISEQARITILCWCRQAGKDFTASLKAVLDAIDTGENWYIVSLTQRQALATAQKAQMHIKAILGVLSEMEETEDWVNDVKVTSFGLRLPNGAAIVALPGKDPDALAGLSGNVIFTEMALFPNQGEAHWRVVFPLTTRGYKVWAISTPRGPETKFSELRRNVQGMYAVHNLTIYDAVEKGLELRDENGVPITPEDLRRLYNDEPGWSREYLCIEGDDHDPLIPWKNIHECAGRYEIPWVEIKGKPDTPLQELTEQFNPQDTDFWTAIRREFSGSPVLGWDIATSGDFSVIAYGERRGIGVWLRALIIMHGVEDFDYQEEIVSRAMETGATGEGDASGMGREACQRIGKRFGEHAWGALVFSSATKTPLFTQLRDSMQSVRVHYPDLDLIKYDIHALGKMGMGVAGTILRVQTNRNTLDRRSHCDIATALALMVDAASACTGPAQGMLATEYEEDRRNDGWRVPDHSDDYVHQEEWAY